MMLVLNRLAAAPLRVWDVDDLRRDIPGYDRSPGGDRNWHLDCAALRARGLIKTGITSRNTLRRRGAQYGLPLKPADLHLSQREHAALVDARRARGIPDLPGPLDGEATRGSALATIGEALRRVEESGEWMTVGELARDMGERPDRLLEKIKLAWCLDLDGLSVLDRVLTVVAYDGERRLPAPEVRVWVVRGGEAAPLLGRGLAALGTGAYTLDEVDDRLDLIEDVLAGTVPGDAKALESAKFKLLRWRELLVDGENSR